MRQEEDQHRDGRDECGSGNPNKGQGDLAVFNGGEEERDSYRESDQSHQTNTRCAPEERHQSFRNMHMSASRQCCDGNCYGVRN